MIERPASTPTIPIPFQRLLEIVVPGESRDDRARPMLDDFPAFEESFNRFPGFQDEVQGVFQERVGGRIRFHTYVVRE